MHYFMDLNLAIDLNAIAGVFCDYSLAIKIIIIFCDFRTLAYTMLAKLRTVYLSVPLL